MSVSPGSINLLKPRISVYSNQKGVIDLCFKRLKAINRSIVTVSLPKKQQTYHVRKNYHGQGYSVYTRHMGHVYKGYIVVPGAHQLTKILQTLATYDLLVHARIT